MLQKDLTIFGAFYTYIEKKHCIHLQFYICEILSSRNKEATNFYRFATSYAYNQKETARKSFIKICHQTSVANFHIGDSWFCP